MERTKEQRLQPRSRPGGRKHRPHSGMVLTAERLQLTMLKGRLLAEGWREVLLAQKSRWALPV